MTHSNKRIIERYLACIAIFQIIFLIGVFAFHNYLLTPNPFFRTLTLEEWNWLVQQKSYIFCRLYSGDLPNIFCKTNPFTYSHILENSDPCGRFDRVHSAVLLF